MKPRALLPSFLLAILTVLMQLSGSVAQKSDLASAVSPSEVSPEKHPVAKTPPTKRVLSPASAALLGARQLPHITTSGTARTAVGGSVIEQDDIKPRHRRLARRMFKLFPAACQAKLKNFHVLYGTPKHRGLAGKGIVIVSGEVPDQEFLGLLAHEMAGHFWDITCITGKKESGASVFRDGAAAVYNDDPSVSFYEFSWLSSTQRRPTATAKDFVTGYAAARDPFEDLAESMSYYLLQPDAFEKRAKSNAVLAAKLAWLHEHFPMTTRVAIGTDTTPGIAWDATKLSYRWIGL